MRSKLNSVVVIIVLVCCMLCACNKTETQNTNNIPELSSIQVICELATQECYYHTVAKIEKSKNVDQELFDFLKQDRIAWIEYAAIAKIGIDVTKVKLNVTDNSVEINIPEAELFSLTVDPDSYNQDSFYESADYGIVKNAITADMATKAVQAGQIETKAAILSNKSLMKNAQIRAQQLIKNYIDEVGKATGVTYNVKWVYDDGTASEETPELE